MENNLWVEKYRPECLDDINSQQNVITSLKSSLITKNIPHLIFYGPSGCGKTSTILALAKELFGSSFKDRTIEMNASDERGIDVIRDKIKIFAKLSVNTTLTNCPQWKIIILDETDTMSSDSQFALRRIIEQYSKITRFCMICNYSNKIIEPIASRCSAYRFIPISQEFIFSRLKYISNCENFNCNDNIMHKIIDISRGDMRKSINLLQKCYNYNYDCISMLNDMSGRINEDLFNEIITNITNKNINKINELINYIYNQGYSLVNQIILFHNYILNSNLSSKNKSLAIIKLCEVDQSLLKGCDEYIQYMNLIYYLITILNL
jgi:replication factor C subunit 2/4